MVLFFVLSCNDDDADFMIQLNEPFLAVKGEKYTCITDDGDEIIIEVEDLEDNRTYGRDCSSVSAGATGKIEVETGIKINKNKYSNIFNLRGCESSVDRDHTHPAVPEIKLESYTVKAIRVFPISTTQNKPPSSKKDYEIKLIILK